MSSWYFVSRHLIQRFEAFLCERELQLTFLGKVISLEIDINLDLSKIHGWGENIVLSSSFGQLVTVR